MSHSRHLSVHVDRPVDEVYSYLCDPSRLSEWAAGVSPDVEVRFAPPNPYGVADHDVSLPDGTVISVPLRVLPDGDGAEVVFTLRRAPGADDAAFEADDTAVRTDLETLRQRLEGS
ncbi:MAG: SRPBCC family protein [Nocardioidaceae bacterium]